MRSWSASGLGPASTAVAYSLLAVGEAFQELRPEHGGDLGRPVSRLSRLTGVEDLVDTILKVVACRRHHEKPDPSHDFGVARIDQLHDPGGFGLAMSSEALPDCHCFVYHHLRRITVVWLRLCVDFDPLQLAGRGLGGRLALAASELSRAEAPRFAWSPQSQARPRHVSAAQVGCTSQDTEKPTAVCAKRRSPATPSTSLGSTTRRRNCCEVERLFSAPPQRERRRDQQRFPSRSTPVPS